MSIQMWPSSAALAVVTWLVVVIACGSPPGDVLSSGSLPSMATAVGPIPGGGSKPSPPSNPFAGDRAAAGRGRQLFVRFNCSGCHGDHGGGGMGPSLRDVDWMYGNGDAQIFSSIAEGRAHGMPSWATKLPEDDIWRLVAYIKALRTRNEPQPPI
jgi:cytochrome c oxidase cbb3-type subunit 3